MPKSKKVTRDTPQKVPRVTFLPQNWKRKTPLGRIKIKSHPRRAQFSLKMKILIKDQHAEKLETLTDTTFFNIFQSEPPT